MEEGSYLNDVWLSIFDSGVMSIDIHYFVSLREHTRFRYIFSIYSELLATSKIILNMNCLAVGVLTRSVRKDTT